MYITTTFTAAAKKYNLDQDKVGRLIQRVGSMNAGFCTNDEIRARTDGVIRDLGLQAQIDTQPTGRLDCCGDATYELHVKVLELRKEVA